jgi:hypothetical protein
MRSTIHLYRITGNGQEVLGMEAKVYNFFNSICKVATYCYLRRAYLKKHVAPFSLIKVDYFSPIQLV